MRYDAVIFDLDGVLVDSEPLHLKAVEIVLADHGIRLTPEQAAQQTGITIHQFFDKLVDEWGYPGPRPGEDWVAEKRAIFRARAPEELRPVAGVDTLLRALRGKTRIGLASSSPRNYVNWCLGQFAWTGMFDAVCTVDDVRRPKPDPEMYRLAVERLDVRADAALVFEDSPAGIKAATGAGLRCVGVATSYTGDELRACGARKAIADFTDTATLERILNAEQP